MDKYYVYDKTQFDRLKKTHLTPEEAQHLQIFRTLSKTFKKRKRATAAEQYALYTQLLRKSQMLNQIEEKEARQREDPTRFRLISPTVVAKTNPINPSDLPAEPLMSLPGLKGPKIKRSRNEALRRRLGIALDASASPPKRALRSRRQRQPSPGPATPRDEGVLSPVSATPKARPRKRRSGASRQQTGTGKNIKWRYLPS